MLNAAVLSLNRENIKEIVRGGKTKCYYNQPQFCKYRKRLLLTYCTAATAVQEAQSTIGRGRHPNSGTQKVLQSDFASSVTEVVWSEDEVVRQFQECGQVSDVIRLIEKQQGRKKNRRKGVMSFACVSCAFAVLAGFLRGMPKSYQFKGSFSAFLFAYQQLLYQIQQMDVAEMNAKGAATIAHSMATAWITLPRKSEMGKFWPKFMKVIQVVTQQKEHLDAQSIAAAMWAMEKTNFKDYQQYWDLIDAACKIAVDQWSVESICKVLWCLGNVHGRFPFSKQFHRPKIFQLAETLLPLLIPQLNQVSALDLGKLMSSLRRLRIYNAPFMTAFQDFLVDNTYKCNFRNSSVCQICLAFADLGISVEYRNRVVKRLTQQYCNRYDGKPQHIANMIYALGVLECKAKYPRKIIELMLKQMADGIPEDFFKEIELVMIRRSQLQLRGMLKQELELPSAFEKLCIEAMKEQVKFQRKEPFDSVGQDIFAAVLTVFPNASRKVTFLNDEFFAHVRFFDGVQFVVVDISSPSNYLSNVPDQLINSLQSKHMLLQSAGYRVVVVNNYKWKTDQQYREAIIEDLQTPRQKQGVQNVQFFAKDKQQKQQKFSLSSELERQNLYDSSSEASDNWQDLTIEDFIN